MFGCKPCLLAVTSAVCVFPSHQVLFRKQQNLLNGSFCLFIYRVPAALCLEPGGNVGGNHMPLNLFSRLGYKKPFQKDPSSSLAGMLQEEIPSPGGFWLGTCAGWKERDQLGRQTNRQVQSWSLLHFNLKLKLPLEHRGEEKLKRAQTFKSIPLKDRLLSPWRKDLWTIG